MTASSRQNLSHYHLSTCDIGELVPVAVVECLPGDVIRHSASVMMRLSPMAAPVMHNMVIRVDHFFVPNRLSWDADTAGVSWEDFITGGPQGNDASAVPTMLSTGATRDVHDHMGIPRTAGIPIDKMPIRAYNLCYNEWYRDQDLSVVRDLDKVDLAQIAYEKDYYTAARPWPQKGEAVTLPLGVEAPVIGRGTGANYVQSGTQTDVGTLLAEATTGNVKVSGSVPGTVNIEPKGGTGYGPVADLANATAVDIVQLRIAAAVQRWKEARARWGSRYSELCRREFGATPLDSRLQRPEHLGGGRSMVSVSEVLQTAPESGAPARAFGVGDMYGHGIGFGKSNGYKRKVQEHGYMISLMSVRPKAVYQNGVARNWLKRHKEDFYTPQLAHIGQQEVLTQEVWADATNAGDVFGWNDRYQEYRNQRSLVTGEFRDTLNYWHLARNFTEAPALNQAFVEVDPASTKRIFNEQTQASLWVTTNHRLQMARRITAVSTPRLL